jgi:pyruvate kinase
MPCLQPDRRSPELAELFARRGAVKAVAEGLGISTAAVSTWRVVPTNRREDVARILGVPIEAVPVRASQPERAA